MRGESYFDAFIGSQCFSNANPNDEDVFFNLHPNRKYHLISEIYTLKELKSLKSISNNWLLYQDDMSMFYIGDIHYFSDELYNFTFDYLIVGKNSVRCLNKIAEHFQFDFLILDATISPKFASIIKKQFNFSKNIHSITLDGAKTISI